MRDREHPYRQILDRAAAGSGNVRILEKDSPLNRADIDAGLCVMLLMLQSASRWDKATLKFFRDRGDVHGFFPPADDMPAHDRMRAEHGNLETINQTDIFSDNVTPGMIRYSLANALRVCRPIVVMDEGHHAYTELALETIRGLNPSFVLELSATPDARANILCNVSGVDLEREEMIKLPINVTVEESGQDWKNCLRRAYDQIVQLQAEADRLRADTGRYIRPILLVQVERTGKDQRDSDHIHAKDAREYLQSLGVSDNEIAEKTAEVDELKEFGNKKLLDPTCPIRVIITKQALSEGWDCPFAYVLCSLAVNRNKKALTQLVGRILRQPDARKTGRSALDECYVFCHDASTGDVVTCIKKGLEEDGMGDLAGRIVGSSTAPSSGKSREVLTRREKFAQLKVYFPQVLWTEGETRLLDYERDILSAIDWGSVDVEDISVQASEIRRTRFAKVGLDVITSGTVSSTELQEAAEFDPIYATRSILDIVPNPWEARRIVGDVVNALRRDGWDDARLGMFGSDIISTLRKELERLHEEMCETEFRRALADGRIQFRLDTDATAWKLPETLSALLPDTPVEVMRADLSPLENSVFRIFTDDLNGFEVTVARYLDPHNAVTWWHRNVARGQGYGLQGWRRNRVYPDILIGLQHGDGVEHYLALETKGDQLSGNLDTVYKQSLFKALSDHYQEQTAGELGIRTSTGATLRCEMVLESMWPGRVARLLEHPDELSRPAEPLTWVAATELRNWCEGEPVLDWLDLYGESRGYLKDTQRPGYKPETDMSVFIREKGQGFEAGVLRLIGEKLTVETAYRQRGDEDGTVGNIDEESRELAYERTLALMREGVDVIYQAVVKDPEHSLWGKPDLLIRSDRLNSLIDIAPLARREASIGAPAIGQADYHYVVVDIKFASFTLRSNGELGGELSKRAQVAVYSRALGAMQGYQPEKAFLLGRSVDLYEQTGTMRSCFGRLAPVKVRGVLMEADEAAAWVRRVKRDGADWDIMDSQLPEMQLNMSNQQDAPWHMTKRELAPKLRPVSALWQMTPRNSKQLHQAGIFRWDDPRFDVDQYTAHSSVRAEKITAIIAAQRSSFRTTPPSQIKIDREVWATPRALEFYVDFETVSDLDDDFSALPIKGGSPRIFMVGCGHIEHGEWKFAIFTADAMTDADEECVLRDWTDHMEAVRQRLAPEIERPLVFHWSKAEVSFYSSAYNAAIKRLSTFSHHVRWYDLLTEVIRAHPFVVNGALAFGLKAVAKAMHALGLIKTKWEDGPVDGLAAMVGAWWCANEAARRGLPMTELPLMREIAAYNEVDTKVMWEILTYLRSH